MNLTVTFESAELEFRQILEEFFISVYDEKSLRSHGIEHHRRVWKYAKEITVLLSDNNSISDHTFPYKLIIACYLHDIGMSVDHGVRHGKHGRDLCIRFLLKNNLSENDYKDALEAIENHDKKDYSVNTVSNELMLILSVADDLDAFGFTGIFRYSEIYLKRGINPETIGHLVIENARNRFDNLAKIFRFSDEFVRKHKKRFDILENFFAGYNKQVVSYQFGGPNPAGYCGVVEILNKMLMDKIAAGDFQKDPDNYSYDSVISWFFDGLTSELT